MIVEAMSYLEAYNQIESDLPKVQIWADKYLPRENHRDSLTP